MIYITKCFCNETNNSIIRSVWSVNCKNVEEKYIDFMIEKSNEINIVINSHWLNVMDFNHNTHLTIDEYEIKQKQWEKIIRMWNIDKYISEILKGVKVDYTEIVRH